MLCYESRLSRFSPVAPVVLVAAVRWGELDYLPLMCSSTVIFRSLRGCLGGVHFCPFHTVLSIAISSFEQAYPQDAGDSFASSPPRQLSVAIGDAPSRRRRREVGQGRLWGHAARRVLGLSFLPVSSLFEGVFPCQGGDEIITLFS